mgnify:CR=1 FL=1
MNQIGLSIAWVILGPVLLSVCFEICSLVQVYRCQVPLTHVIYVRKAAHDFGADFLFGRHTVQKDIDQLCLWK